MNKMITGALAGTAGIALLAGGFSTYATWTASDQIDAGRIQTGTLEVHAGPAAWDDLSTPAIANDWVVATDKMVPGDRVRLTQPLDVVAEGKNLKGVKLEVTGWTNIAGFEAGDLTVAGLSYGGKSFTGQALEWRGADQLAALNAAEQITVDFTMPTTADGSMNASIDLSNVTVTVTQLF